MIARAPYVSCIRKEHSVSVQIHTLLVTIITGRVGGNKRLNCIEPLPDEGPLSEDVG